MTTACIPSTLVAPNVRSPERPTLLNLLIVDDDRFVREACREAAVALGYSGKTTESIEQAMLMAESQSIDVVLLGAKLTDTPQLEILQRFKERHPSIEVIVMTKFLDEVGELPLDLQSKLLWALQEREIRPVGSTTTIPIDVRILAATNRDLEQAVAQGTFRRDLYFRLNVLSLRIPPLRERREDIPLLVTSFLERLARDSDRLIDVSEDVMKALLAYDWPGNVRELENCIERCCAMNSGPLIHNTDLASSITGARVRLSDGSSAARIMRIADLEKQAIVGAIEKLNGDKLMAAKLLGIGKTTLYRKLKEYAHIS